jgi:hypothetical protein
MHLAAGIACGHQLQELQELLMAVACVGEPRDLTGGDVERGEQLCRAMADVVMGASLWLSRSHRQEWLGAVERRGAARERDDWPGPHHPSHLPNPQAICGPQH